MPDIPLSEAMLCYISGLNGGAAAFKVVPHPDHAGLSDAYTYTVGACFTDWRKNDDRGRKLQLLIDVWHATAFYDVPPAMAHEGLLAIPEYRSMLADDCLPQQYRAERESE